MTRHLGTKVFITSALGLASQYAAAAGFQLMEQNASGLGNAYAGSAAVAENASTIFFNPAGMTQLRDREASLGLSAVKTSFKFSDNGSSAGVLTGAGDGGDAGSWGYIPNGYASWAVSPDLYLGLGVGAPFGLKTEYTTPWVGSAQSTSFDIKTYNVNPSIAYRVNSALSIGGGLNWQRITADYLRVAAVASSGLASSPVVMNLAGDAWGWNVGALFTVSPETKVGASYRSSISQDVTGNINISGAAASGSSTAKANIKLPDVFILSGTQQLSDKWQLLADLSWTGWSSIPRVDIIRTSATGSGLPAGSTAQTLDTDFRDTWRVAVGANYQLAPDMKLKMGVAYDQTPVKGEATRLTSLPDNDRTWLSLGTQWLPSKGSALDLGLAYLYIKEAPIDNNQATSSRGRVTGSYSSNAWILGVQYSFAF